MSGTYVMRVEIVKVDKDRESKVTDMTVHDTSLTDMVNRASTALQETARLEERR